MVLLFFRLDEKSAYWNVELDEESSYLTTFNTHRGYYGLNRSQDIFQKRMDQTFERCKGLVLIADDIQVFGTDENHDTHLHEAMESQKCRNQIEF